jgi:hypothetical protein
MIGFVAESLLPSRLRRIGAPVALLLLLLAVSCAAPIRLMTLPSGAGSPAGDAVDALAAASLRCRGVSTFSSEVGVSGTIGGRRVPRARLIVGIVASASVLIDAPAPFGASAFIFAARGGEATLLLPRDNRVLEHAQPAAVLEALTGVPLGPEGLKAALTGCGVAPKANEARHVGDGWIVMPDADGELYLARGKTVEPWQIVAATHGEGAEAWRAEYRDFIGGLPRSIHLSATDRARFDLGLTLSQVDVNTTIEDAAFAVKVPASAVPMTLAELRGADAVQ